MLKVAGSVLLLAGSTILGTALVGRLKQREKALAALIQALTAMERELSFRLPPMGEWLLRAAEGSPEPAASFLRDCGESLDRQEGRPLVQLWQEAALERLQVLNQEDLTPLLTLGTVLGRYGWEDQKKALAVAGERLADALAQAQEERQGKGKVYRTLSLAAGIFLVIILI